MIAKIAAPLRVVALLVFAAALGGCDAIDRLQTSDTENLLAAAGFQRLADGSAEGAQDLANLPPQRIVAQRRDGKALYVYADPRNCRCVYIGAPQAYARYSELEKKEALARSMASDAF